MQQRGETYLGYYTLRFAYKHAFFSTGQDLDNETTCLDRSLLYDKEIV